MSKERHDIPTLIQQLEEIHMTSVKVELVKQSVLEELREQGGPGPYRDKRGARGLFGGRPFRILKRRNTPDLYIKPLTSPVE